MGWCTLKASRRWKFRADMGPPIPIGSSEPPIFLPGHGEQAAPAQRTACGRPQHAWGVKSSSDGWKCHTTIWNRCKIFHCKAAYSSCHTHGACTGNGKKQRKMNKLYHLLLVALLSTDLCAMQTLKHSCLCIHKHTWFTYQGFKAVGHGVAEIRFPAKVWTMCIKHESI